VNPLVVIERQIRRPTCHRADTRFDERRARGQFQNSADGGVDCDNGTNCRQGGFLGSAKLGRRATCLSTMIAVTATARSDNITICAAT